MEDRGDQGRVRVLIVIALLLAVEATPTLLRTENTPLDLQTVLGRGGLVVILLTFLWLGHGWARWLLIILSGLSGLLAGTLVVTKTMLPLFPVAVGALVSVYLLLTPEVKAFQDHQRSKG